MTRRTRTRGTPRWRTLGAVAAVAALGLAACGTAGGSVATAEGETDPAGDDLARELLDPDTQALAFAECMRDNGVDMPDPAPGQGGLSDAFHGLDQRYDRATIEQAFAACEDQLPQFDHGDDGHGPDGEVVLALAECLREQGLDVPDNVFEGSGLHDLDEAEAAAMELCRNQVFGGGQ